MNAHNTPQSSIATNTTAAARFEHLGRAMRGVSQKSPASTPQALKAAELRHQAARVSLVFERRTTTDCGTWRSNSALVSDACACGASRLLQRATTRTLDGTGTTPRLEREHVLSLLRLATGASHRDWRDARCYVCNGHGHLDTRCYLRCYRFTVDTGIHSRCMHRRNWHVPGVVQTERKRPCLQEVRTRVRVGRSWATLVPSNSALLTDAFSWLRCAYGAAKRER